MINWQPTDLISIVTMLSSVFYHLFDACCCNVVQCIMLLVWQLWCLAWFPTYFIIGFISIVTLLSSLLLFVWYLLSGWALLLQYRSMECIYERHASKYVVVLHWMWLSAHFWWCPQGVAISLRLAIPSCAAITSKNDAVCVSSQFITLSIQVRRTALPRIIWINLPCSWIDI